ncbi:DUF1566 domain-containing protein [Delftia sp. CH05]|uniref:DUF1566 domain-containing protein n=1 Tax=Delftia sp. CH05 TaxID=2692194 RepID=UPI00135D64B0|nr:DUF1566 domain-containing protein [Delftia sp. CH05]MXN31016.1 DUF1566 domain-containing protein [Delftia sp. CH05]
MNVHIGTNTAPIIFVPSPEAMASMEALMKGLGRVEPAVPTAVPSADHGRPAIGEYWEGQGGHYAGDFRGSDGSVCGLIVAPGEDVGRAAWGPTCERELSDWDGLANTARLRNECPAAKLAVGFESDEHSDFYLPARRELQLAAANVPHLFGKESWYWSSTTLSGDYAWAVDFECGRADNIRRRYEFRVRPFRRFIY